VEGAGDEQDDVVDHVAVGDVVEEGGLVTHVLELRHQLLAQLVVNHGHLQRSWLIDAKVSEVGRLEVELQVVQSLALA